MEVVMFQEAATLDLATMVERVVTDAQRHFEGEADEAQLARWSEEAVVHVWGEGVVIATFVPILALREVHERVVEAKTRR